MPRRPVQESAEDRAIREIEAEDDDAVQRIALEAGPPADASRLSDADLDALWAVTDPLVDDPDAFASALMTSGIEPDLLGQLLVVREYPEWQPLYAQPTQDAEMADMLARLAQFPYRWALLLDIDDPEEQVRIAERLDRRFQKQHAGMQDGDPTPTPATMPMDTPMPAPEQPPTMPGAPGPGADQMMPMMAPEQGAMPPMTGGA